MNIFDAYLPLLSHAAHLLRAFPDGGDAAGLAECARLAARAKSAARDEDGAAWFPVRAWLGEKLPALFSDSADGAGSGSGVEAEFQSRLNALLTRAAAGAAAPEDLDLLRLHTLCLELGYGAHGDGRVEERRRRYIRHCRKTLAAGASALGVLSARAFPAGADRENAPRLSRRLFRAAALFAAPAATLGLYCLYRAWLHSLLLDVIG